MIGSQTRKSEMSVITLTNGTSKRVPLRLGMFWPDALEGSQHVCSPGARFGMLAPCKINGLTNSWWLPAVSSLSRLKDGFGPSNVEAGVTPTSPFDKSVEAFRVVQFYQLWSDLGFWARQAHPVLGPDARERSSATSGITRGEYLAACDIQKDVNLMFAFDPNGDLLKPPYTLFEVQQ